MARRFEDLGYSEIAKLSGDELRRIFFGDDAEHEPEPAPEPEGEDTIDLDAIDDDVIDAVASNVHERVRPIALDEPWHPRETRREYCAREERYWREVVGIGEPRAHDDNYRNARYGNLIDVTRLDSEQLAQLRAAGGSERVKEEFEKVVRRAAEQEGQPPKPKALRRWEREQREKSRGDK